MRGITHPGPGALHTSPAYRAHGPARIGPNAVVQTVAALQAAVGRDEASAILAATTSWRLDRLPAAMVDEDEVAALLQRVRTEYPGAMGERILMDAGRRTADYLLRARIPAVVQWMLRSLPRATALRILLRVIARNSWTFAGSARFAVGPVNEAGAHFSLDGCPLCSARRADTAACGYYAATFEHLVRRIVSPSATVREEECAAAGGRYCRFRIVVRGETSAPRAS